MRFGTRLSLSSKVIQVSVLPESITARVRSQNVACFGWTKKRFTTGMPMSLQMYLTNRVCTFAMVFVNRYANLTAKYSPSTTHCCLLLHLCIHRYWSKYESAHCVIYLVYCDRVKGRIRYISKGYTPGGTSEKTINEHIAVPLSGGKVSADMRGHLLFTGLFSIVHDYGRWRILWRRAISHSVSTRSDSQSQISVRLVVLAVQQDVSSSTCSD